MEISLFNCNNIISGSLSITENALNVKYAINGTGKSTIAKAIDLSCNSESDLAFLTPYQFIEDGDEEHKPNVSGNESISNVMIFNEDYIRQYVYQKDDLIKNSFEIFVRTPDYDRHMEQIQLLLQEMNKAFQNNPELNELITDFTEFVDGCGKNQRGLAASGSIVKGLGNGNLLANIPSELDCYRPYLLNSTEARNVKWLKWQSEGKIFLDLAEQCPYCASQKEFKKSRIETVSNTYDSKVVDHLNKMLKLFEKLSLYFTDDTNEELKRISESADNMSQSQKDYLFEIKTQVSNILSLLINLKNLGFNTFKDVDKVKDELDRYRVNLSMYSHLNSLYMNEKTNPINASLDGIIEKAGKLQGEVNQQKKLIEKTVQDNSGLINDFLQCAGYNYRISINEDEGNGFRMILSPVNSDMGITSANEHLSYGERNALALSLFMFSAIKENPDLIILDDPISSFDGNKKFALLNMLFLGKKSLKNRTVLLLTHDFNTVIDIIHTLPHKFSPAPVGAFLSTNEGVLREQVITKDDIKSFKEIALLNIQDNIDNLNKLIYLRRLYEFEGNKGNEWQMLSNLFHKRETPEVHSATESRTMSEDEINEAIIAIREYIPDFDYHYELRRANNEEELLMVYRNSRSNYEKLQIYRIRYNENSSNPVVKKFVNETFHVENDFIFQLNPSVYDTVPWYIINICDQDMTNREE